MAIYSVFFSTLAQCLGETDDLIWSRELGAVHHARWMSKIIFLLKIFLVGNRFPLSARELTAIKILVELVVYVYVYFGFACPVAQDAPSLTLQLLSDLQRWSNRKKRLISSPKHRVALTCIKKLDRHTWYLSPRHFVIALWSDKVANDVKVEMAQCLVVVVA